MVTKLDNYVMSLVLILQLMGSIQLNAMVLSYGTLSGKTPLLLVKIIKQMSALAKFTI